MNTHYFKFKGTETYYSYRVDSYYVDQQDGDDDSVVSYFVYDWNDFLVFTSRDWALCIDFMIEDFRKDNDL